MRVVLSSTPDLRAERDELSSVLLPEVRRAAEERGLTWLEPSDDGVPPVVVGLLGQRYGWDGLERELIQHAIGRSTQTCPAYFYLRDMAWVDSLPLSRRISYVETPTPEENALLGQVAAGMVAAGRRAKLEELKAGVRSSGHQVREFTDAASLLELVRTDLLALVDQLAPAAS